MQRLRDYFCILQGGVDDSPLNNVFNVISNATLCKLSFFIFLLSYLFAITYLLRSRGASIDREQYNVISTSWR